MVTYFAIGITIFLGLVQRLESPVQAYKEYYAYLKDGPPERTQSNFELVL
jgi:hypothetical protein